MAMPVVSTQFGQLLRPKFQSDAIHSSWTDGKGPQGMLLDAVKQ